MSDAAPGAEPSTGAGEPSSTPPGAKPAAARPPRWERFRRGFVDRYLTIDARSLGLGRIVLAIVLLFDLIRRVPDITLFYTNLGLVPNHMMLWRPPTQWMFSFFFMLSLPDEVAYGFALCGVIYFLMLIGWRTRLMQFLAAICVLSLHGRVTLMENGGDWMLGELAVWSAFLPLGRRFSVDAVLASLRKRRETTAAELADRTAMESQENQVSGPQIVTLAALAIVLQIANAYIFNALHKGGQTWRQGTAVHYVLHQDRMVTWFAVFMRPHMSLWLSRILSWGSLATEAALPLLLLSPFYRVWTRRFAIVAIIGLHTGFQLFINLGTFSWAMIGYTPFLLTAADWKLFARRAARRNIRLTAYFDAGCGICFQIVRLWARLDRLSRVRFVSNQDAPADVSPELLQQTLLVLDETTGRRYTRADAVAQVLGAFPVGWLWSAPLRLPGLRQLANAAYGFVARRRERISVALGLAACALPVRPPLAEGGEAPVPAPAPIIIEAGPSPIRRGWGKVVTALREGAVLAMMIVLVSETLFINAAIPKFLKHDQPLWIKRLVAYPRFIQAWSMFSSDAPMTDLNMVVDATTVDGRHVDPYSQVAGRYPDPGTKQIPVRMDNDSLIFNYSGRIPDNAAYHQALTEWILRYPDRTGNPKDQITRFDCYLVEDDSPPIGEMQPRNLRTRKFLSYPH